MLLEIAIGDAYGAGFEFSPKSKIEQWNTLTAYQDHELGIKAGNYTDDTQMSLAIAELLLQGSAWTPAVIAEHFVQCFKRDPRPGYAQGFYSFLQSVDNGEEFLRRIRPNSTRNGACMRAAPLGILDSLGQILEYAEIQAKVTHNTPVGIRSSQAVALAAHYFVYGLGEKQHLRQFIEEATQTQWDNHWKKPIACCGIETVNGLLTVLTHCNGLAEILIKSVNFSGDVDTLAALGLAIAAQSNLYVNDLPDFLLSDLENGRYGKNYLIDIDKQLGKLSSAPPSAP